MLSSYGPGKEPPASLFENNEYSSEEVRWRFYEQAAAGMADQADQEAIAVWNNALRSQKDIMDNADNVVKYMELSETKHPNRYDFAAMQGSETREQIKQRLGSQSQTQPQSSNSFSNNTTSGFGTATGLGQQTASPFGKPALSGFGQPSTTQATGAFGQPSQPTAFGATGAFGKPAFGASGFGQSSAFGQPAKPASGFGQPPQRVSPFGQPTTSTAAFGQLPQQSSSFGQASQPQATFGQTAGAPAFGSSGFGQTAPKNPFAAPSAASGLGQAGQTGSGFGQSPFGQATQTSAPFGQPAQSTSPFSQPSSNAPINASGIAAFAQHENRTSSTFGQPSQSNSNPFSQPAQAKPSPFGQPSQTGSNPFAKASDTKPSPFGQPSQATSSPFARTSSAASSGNASPFANQAITGGFGVPSGPSALKNQATTSGFGAPSAPSAFSKPNDTEKSNPFAPKRDAPSLFGKPAQSISAANAQGSAVTATARKPSATSTALTQAVNTDLASAIAALSAGGPHPLTGTSTAPLHITETLQYQAPTFDQSKQLRSFHGRRVQYVKNEGKDEKELPTYPCIEIDRRLERVWFPHGPAGQDIMLLNQKEQLGDLQVDDAEYAEDVLGMWKGLFETGGFGGGLPLVPPRREWCAWDF